MVGPERLYLASRLNLTEAQVSFASVLIILKCFHQIKVPTLPKNISKQYTISQHFICDVINIVYFHTCWHIYEVFSWVFLNVVLQYMQCSGSATKNEWLKKGLKMMQLLLQRDPFPLASKMLNSTIIHIVAAPAPVMTMMQPLAAPAPQCWFQDIQDRPLQVLVMASRSLCDWKHKNRYCGVESAILYNRNRIAMPLWLQLWLQQLQLRMLIFNSIDWKRPVLGSFYQLKIAKN
jgi:hypothetical protein